MSDIDRLIESIVKYRNARDWKQFHNPKDSSIALSLEASEVLQHFLWQSKEEMDEYVKKHKNEIANELSDVLYWTLLISHDLNIDMLKAFDKKMKENRRKYPVKKAKGRHTKYTEL